MTHARTSLTPITSSGARPNEIARRVKLADLADNTRLDRTILRPQRFERDVARIRQYVLSYKFLTDQITEEQYRSLMGNSV